VDENISPGALWFDAGCGHLSFHSHQREQRIRYRVQATFGCDLDFEALKVSPPGITIVQANLEAIPYRTETFDVATMNSVAEHLADPLAVLKEIARVLKPHGRFIMHTPNLFSYYVIGSRLLPESVKLAVAKRLEGRIAADVYFAFYRANTSSQIQGLLEAAGFHKVRILSFPTEATTARLWAPLWLAELMFVRLTPRRWWTNLCVIAEKVA
jgi:SAM-dependent methyltransferase